LKNLPNWLTFIRILVIPILMVLFYLPFKWGHGVASLVFAIASLTDWLDGYLARVMQLSTRLGAFLDPVADKLMVSIALVMIVGESQFQFVNFPTRVFAMPIFLITIPAAIIVSREIIVSALREWMAELGKRASVAVSRLGKIKTVIQMLALVVLLYCSPSTSGYIVVIGYSLLYLAAILTLWSMIIYLRAAWGEITRQ